MNRTSWLRRWVRCGAVLVAVLCVGFVSQARAAFAPLTAGGELYATTGVQPSLGPMAVAGSTLVSLDGSGAGRALAWTAGASGWSTEAQSATLNVPGIAATTANSPSDPQQITADGATVAIGAPDESPSGVSDSGVVWVYGEPSTGWSGTVNPSAALETSPLTARTYLGASIAESGNTIMATAGPYSDAPVAAYAYNEPTGGWSGTIGPSATLLPVSGYSAGSDAPLGIEPGNAFVEETDYQAGTRTIEIYPEPATGWTGSVTPDGALITPGIASLSSFVVSGRLLVASVYNVSVDGKNVYEAAYVYKEPAAGWVGNIEPSATLLNVGTGEVAIDGNQIVIHGLPLLGTVSNAYDVTASWVFSEPPNGWRGDLEAKPMIFAQNILTSDYMTTAGNQLFSSGGNTTINEYTIGAGDTYAPTALSITLTGTRAHKPQVVATVAASAPLMQTLSLTLPAGLTLNHRSSVKTVTVTGAGRYTATRNGRRLTVHFANAVTSAKIRIAAAALSETRSFQKSHTGALPDIFTAHIRENTGQSQTASVAVGPRN